MRILALDTTGAQASCAIVDNYIVIGEILANARTGAATYTHSEVLMPAVEQLFALTRVERASITHVAYTSGPGSFTGVRIAASAALGIAKTLNVPTIAVPTLDAMAYNMKEAGGQIVPMLDARRGQVYFAAYENDKRVTDYMAAAVEQALESIPVSQNVPIFLGCGATAYRTQISEILPAARFAAPHNNMQRAAAAGVLAFEIAPSESVEILYVRHPI